MVDVIGQIVVELANGVIGESRKVANRIDAIQISGINFSNVFVDFS